MCECFACIVLHVLSAHRDQKKALDPLDLVLQMVVSHPVGEPILGLVEEQPVLLPTELPLQSNSCDIMFL